MTAFFVATVTVKDPEKFQEYAEKAGATFGPHGGKPVLRGRVEGTLVGTAGHQVVGIVRFPSTAALRDWYESSEYQAIIPLREDAADMTITTYSA